MMRGCLGHAAALALCFPWISGCGGPRGGETLPPKSEGLPRGGTVVVGISQEPDNLLEVCSSVHSAQDVIGAMFLSLTEVGGDLVSSEPELARSWEFSADGLAVKFLLEPSARWHDGTPVTAHDVAFTHSLHVDPKVGSPARSWKTLIHHVVVEDDHTVTFQFDRKYPHQVMDASEGVILPKHLLEQVPRGNLSRCDFARRPVGNGPFEFLAWEKGERVELAAHEEFFGGRPHLDRVVFRIIPDKRDLLAELEAATIDILEDLPPWDVARFEDSGSSVRIERFPDRTYTYIGWNVRNPLFASGNVRRALGMAIDVQELIDTLCQGYAQPCHGPVPPMLWACHGNLAPLPFDPDSARAALAEEGWLDHNGDGWLDRDGKEFEFELKTNLGNELRVAAAPMIQAQLEEIGVRVIPRSYEWNGLWDSILDRAYEGAVLLGWSVGWKADLKPLFHSESHAGYNHTGYSNPILDLLIDRALAMETLEEAKPLWQEAQAQIVADQPYTFLFITDKIFGVNKRVRGTLPDPRSFYRNLEDWWVPVGQQHSGAPT